MMNPEYESLLGVRLGLSWKAFTELKKNNFIEAIKALCIEKKISWQTINNEIKQILLKCQSEGILFVYPGHLNYPSLFDHLIDPPVGLFIWGRMLWSDKKFISIVGSREPMDQTIEWMEKNIALLVQNKVCVVSGGARGVDQRAHAISLRLGMPTVVFLPSGLFNPYPMTFREWIPLVVKKGGCVVSEYWPNQAMKPYFFPQRNRLIAQLSPITLMVQGQKKSGSMITAKLAAEFGKTVATLPGPVWDPCWSGNNQLLFDGAVMVRDHLDVSAILF